MSQEFSVYSIQRTYIIKPRMNAGKEIFTCDQRIDIPTIEPLTESESVLIPGVLLKIIPCIELAGKFLSEFNLEFETNEGVTVLPVKVGQLENPYTNHRYALVLPRGATGVKSCKIIHKATGKEVQHNFTFGIMPRPYNYDNALFGVISYWVLENRTSIVNLQGKINLLKLTTTSPTFSSIDLLKNKGKRTISIELGALFYNTVFNYPLSSEPTTHKPTITLRGSGSDQVYTLSLNKTKNVVSIDLFTGMIRVCDVNGEIIQQFMLSIPQRGFETLSFENFDDIEDSVLRVTARGASIG